jgi:diguanylate cyclase (GGDEF)-like protein
MRPAVFTRILVVSTILVLLLLAARVWDTERTTGRTIGLIVDTEEDPLAVSEVTKGLPADQAGFEVGDVMTRIGGAPVASFEEVLEHAASFRRDRPVVITVERRGEPIELTVRPGGPMPWGVVGFEMLATLGYLGLVLLARFRAPDDLRARLLAGFSLAVALELSLPESVAGVPDWPLIKDTLYYLLSGLQIGLELHLASTIPRRYSWFSDRPWLAKSYYGAGLAIGTSSAAVVLADGLGVPGFETIATWFVIFFNDALLVLWGITIVAILMTQLRFSKTPGHRSQAIVILCGVLPWALFNITNSIRLQLGLVLPDWTELVQPIVLLIYPITIFVAIFRYHLFDIRVAMRRSLVLITVSVAILAVFLLAVDTSTRRVGEELGTGHLPLALFAFTMVAVGLAFNPLRKKVQELIDERFYPNRLVQREHLADLAANLPTLGSLSSMGQHLVEEVVRAFGVEGATLLVADPRSGILVSLASVNPQGSGTLESSLLLESDDAGIEQLRKARRPIPADIIGSTSPALAQRINAFGAEIGVALVSGATLVGLLLLGPKTNRAGFRTEELDLLRLLSISVATVFENVRLFQSATYEQLTGLLRREAILQALDEEIHRAARYERPLTVGMADLDHFKSVNDTWGHLAGDAILQRVAAVLKNQLRSTDRIGRYGGEEFLFFLPETQLQEGLLVAEKLRAAISQLPSPLEDAPDLRVTVSIGLAELGPQDRHKPTPITDFIDAADTALLDAKKSGRNRVVSAGHTS